MWAARVLSHPVVIALLLAAVTVALYWPVLRHEFVNYDDEDYVTENSLMQTRFDPPCPRLGFTTTHDRPTGIR